MDWFRDNISPPFLSSRSIICQSLSGWTNSPSWSTCNSQPLPHVFPGCCKVIIFLFPDKFLVHNRDEAPSVFTCYISCCVKSQSQDFKITFPSRIPGDRDSQYDSTLHLTSLWSREPFYSVCLVQSILNCLIFHLTTLTMMCAKTWIYHNVSTALP